MDCEGVGLCDWDDSADVCTGVSGCNWPKPCARLTGCSSDVFVDFLFCLILTGKLTAFGCPLLLVTLVLEDIVV